MATSTFNDYLKQQAENFVGKFQPQNKISVYNPGRIEPDIITRDESQGNYNPNEIIVGGGGGSSFSNVPNVRYQESIIPTIPNLPSPSPILQYTKQIPSFLTRNIKETPTGELVTRTGNENFDLYEYLRRTGKLTGAQFPTEKIPEYYQNLDLPTSRYGGLTQQGVILSQDYTRQSLAEAQQQGDTSAYGQSLNRTQQNILQQEPYIEKYTKYLVPPEVNVFSGEIRYPKERIAISEAGLKGIGAGFEQAVGTGERLLLNPVKEIKERPLEFVSTAIAFGGPLVSQAYRFLKTPIKTLIVGELNPADDILSGTIIHKTPISQVTGRPQTYKFVEGAILESPEARTSLSLTKQLPLLESNKINLGASYSEDFLKRDFQNIIPWNDFTYRETFGKTTSLPFETTFKNDLVIPSKEQISNNFFFQQSAERAEGSLFQGVTSRNKQLMRYEGTILPEPYNDLVISRPRLPKGTAERKAGLISELVAKTTPQLPESKPILLPNIFSGKTAEPTKSYSNYVPTNWLGIYDVQQQSTAFGPMPTSIYSVGPLVSGPLVSQSSYLSTSQLKKQIQGLTPSQKIREVQRNLQRIEEAQRQLELQRQIQRQEQAQRQQQGQRSALGLLTLQEQAQRQSGRNKSTTIPTSSKFFNPKVPIMFNDEGRKKRRYNKKRKVPGYETWILRSKRWFLAGGPLSKREAFERGASIVRTSLSSQFKIKPAYTFVTPNRMDGFLDFRPTEKILRAYRLKGGRRIPLKKPMDSEKGH